MDWILLKEEGEIKELNASSMEKPVVIFKHSTRCSISAAALGRLERAWNKQEMGEVKFYFLDILSKRNISQTLEDVYEIRHESPQLLIISQGACVYHTSHMSISYQDIKTQLGKLAVKN